MELVENRTIFDRPLAELLKPNWEKAIYLAIFLVAVASRFWDVGARAMSHDESLHALYSYYLYNGTGYTHNPMMHGPFLFHANAFIYFLFGDTDFTARIVPALFGVVLVMSPLLLRRWLGRLGAVFTSILLLISPSILYYSRYIRNDVYINVWTILLIAALFHFLRSRKAGWFYLGAAALMFSLTTKENAYIFGFIGLVFIVEVYLWERLRYRDQVWLYLGGLVLSGVLLAVGYFLGRPPAPPAEGAEAVEAVSGAAKLVSALLIVIGGSIPIVLVSGSLIQSRHPRPGRIVEAIRALSWQTWLIAIVLMFLIYALLFTTFFTNPAGLVSGVFGSVNYWLAQQEVERGSQPWYYYFLVLTMYEFVPFLISSIALVYYVVRSLVTGQPSAEETEDEFEARGPTAAENSLFVAFLIFWTISSLFIYSWAGEKMPWLVVHPVLPMIVLTGKFAGDLLTRLDWRAVWRRGGALLAILLPLALFGLYTLVTQQPFQGLSLSNLRATGNWFAALIVTLLLLGLTWVVARRLGRRRALSIAFATALAFLSFFTVRFAWLASFVNYDYATELLVYAHGAPGVKLTLDEVADISARTAGDKLIEVAYDNEVTWPMEWYMREYPNRQYYGETPTREKLDVPLVLASERNDAKVKPYLGNRYHRFKRRLVWWPNQQYMGLTWERIWMLLTTPEKREILWNILYWREYPRSTDDWYHVHNFYFYVRKDVAQQIWDFGAAPPVVVELEPDPYLEKHVELNTVANWGSVGTGPGQFNHPRGIAVGPEGLVYVADSDNHRIQVFDAQGTFLRQWGSQCNLETGHGCQTPEGDGQFQEPWGLDVGPDGRVYVADTWNHRIQVFDSQGNFVTKWGFYGQTDNAEQLLYGPRDVAVSADNRVYVTDTGNKRIMVYDSNSTLLDQWGGGGILGGFFEEPVGLDTDPEGDLYVADTWNRRVQVFSNHDFLTDWPVEGWFGESVVNKPYLAVDDQSRVYVTDPEGYLVIVFDGGGELLATFGRYGFDPNSFSLPTGIEVDDEGYVYVTDTDGQRVLKFEPLP